MIGFSGLWGPGLNLVQVCVGWGTNGRRIIPRQRDTDNDYVCNPSSYSGQLTDHYQEQRLFYSNPGVGL